MNDISQLLLQHIRDIPDFPKKGIVFKDITTLLNHKEAFAQTINHLYERYKDKNIDYIVGIEARGFYLWCGVSQPIESGVCALSEKRVNYQAKPTKNPTT